MSIPVIELNGTFTDAAGDPMSGTLSFRLNAPLVDSVGNVVSERVEITSTLNDAGQITDTDGETVGLTLYCTSGGDIAPAGLVYDVKVEVGSRPHRVSVALPDSLGSTVDWADLVPVPASTGVVWTVPDLTAEQARDLVGSTLVAGNGLTSTVDDAGDTVTLDIDTPYTTDEQTKLAGIEDGAQVNTVDSVDGATGAVDLSDTYAPIGEPIATDLATVVAGKETPEGAQAKADAALSTAQATLQPVDADLTAIAGLTPSNDDLVQRKAGVWTNRTPAQVKTDLVLVKGDVGLGNVDNTSDANKPISTATQTALDLKAKKLTHPPFTFHPLLFTGSTGVGAINRGHYIRVLNGSGPITKLAIYVGAQSGNICVAVYRGTAGVNPPTTRIATSGSVACPAIGRNEIALDVGVTIDPDTDWFFLSCDNVTATFGRTGNPNDTSTNNFGVGLAYIEAGAFPAASPAGTLTAAWRTGFIIEGVA